MVVIRSSSPYSGEIQWAERAVILAPGNSAAQGPGRWPTHDGNDAIVIGFWSAPAGRSISTLPTARVYAATASTAFQWPACRVNWRMRSSCWSRLDSMKKMGKANDIYAAVIDDLTFDPDGDAMLTW
jgi:hypothetical protein